MRRVTADEPRHEISGSAGYADRVREYEKGGPLSGRRSWPELPPAESIIDLGAGHRQVHKLLALSNAHSSPSSPPQDGGDASPRHRHRTCPGRDRPRAIPVRDDGAGLVCCATAFHWFDYEKATREIFRVLDGGGALALIWNGARTIASPGSAPSPPAG